MLRTINRWSKGEEVLILAWEHHNEWAFKLKPNDTTLWISGINYYWLLSNGWKQI